MAAPEVVLSVVRDGLRFGVLLPEHLPRIATELLTCGADTPALRRLAGLDLGPFDPRDALELFWDVLLDLGIDDGQDAAVGVAARLLGTAAQVHRLSTGDVLRRFYRLAVAADYPNDHEAVMRLYGLDDEWNGGWGRTREQIESEVSAVLAEIGEVDELPVTVTNAVAASG